MDAEVALEDLANSRALCELPLGVVGIEASRHVAAMVGASRSVVRIIRQNAQSSGCDRCS